MNLQTPSPAPPRNASRVTGSSVPPLPTRVRRILVADDDEGIRQLISSALAGHGFDVNAASDGEQAWDALLHEPYDLLVTDHEMPRLAGIKLIERIRDAGMSLPIIIASGSFPVKSVRGYRQLRIAAVLPKPFGISVLLDTVRYVLLSSSGDTTADHATLIRPQAGPKPIL